MQTVTARTWAKECAKTPDPSFSFRNRKRLRNKAKRRFKGQRAANQSESSGIAELPYRLWDKERECYVGDTKFMSPITAKEKNLVLYKSPFRWVRGTY